MRVVIIGGTGHVGTYLVPRLVEAGHEVINISRGQRQAYQPHAAWQSVRRCAPTARPKRRPAHSARGCATCKPDVVIDMICFTRGQRPPAGRGAAGPGAALSALRHDLGPRPERAGAHHRGAAAPAVWRATASRRRPSRPICLTRRGATASRPPCSIRATSSGRAGRRSTRPATSIRRSLPRLARGEELALPNLGHGDRSSRPRRRCGAGVYAGAGQSQQRRWAKAFMSSRRPR